MNALRLRKAGLALAVLIIAWTPLSAATPERRLSPDELRVLKLNHKPDLALLDVRAPGDFVKGHIQDAVNAPSAAIQRAGLDRAETIVIYCGEDPCPLTSGAYKRLTEDGYKDVAIVAGGLRRCKEERSWRGRVGPGTVSGLTPFGMKPRQ